jgi:di/tricarboxylate transporter
MTLAPGDVLLVEAAPAALEELRSAQGLAAAPPERLARLDAAGGDPAFLELVLTPDSRLVGRSAQAVGLGWRRGALLVGLAREGRTGPAPLRATALRAGDVLLILAPASGRDDLADWLDALPLAGGAEVTREGRTWLAIGLFAAAVLAASLGLVYLPIALGAVVVAYVLTGILPLRDLYTPVEWPVIVLLGSMIPLGAALEASGGTDLLAGALIGLSEGLPAWAILAVLMAVTMTLSDVLNNTATTIVAAPVAISMAERLGVSPDPFLMAVAVAASAAFLTPIGHKNNTLILGPGGYAFGDYWRMGLPLEALILVVSIPVLLVAWPL